MFSGYRFEMIVGCMSAGKSSELIRRIERARLAYLPTIILRPATDTRSKPNHVESRNGMTSQAIVVEECKDILKYSSHAVVIGLDECQFFGDGVVEVIQTLLRQKKKIIASGLDLDYRGKPFGPVPALINFWLSAASAVQTLPAAPSAWCIQANKSWWATPNTKPAAFTVLNHQVNTSCVLTYLK